MAGIPTRSFVGRLFKKLAKRAGVQLHLEPKWKFVGQVTNKKGRHRYFRSTNFDLNTLGASEIARDKDYARHFMRRAGYPLVEGKAFFSKKWVRTIKSKQDEAAGYRYALKLGFPVVVKPNSKSQGTGFALVYNKTEFHQAFRAVEEIDNVILVERFVKGQDYRIVVLDGKVISAYERIPLFVIGDGKSSVRKLLTTKLDRFDLAGRDTFLTIKDARLHLKLKQLGLSLRSIPKKDERVVLLDNANLSAGGESVDVTATAHSRFKKLAISVTRHMGLRLFGVDLMIANGITDGDSEHWILEINAAPGLDHYAASGRKQKRVVEDLYVKVLQAMGR